MHALGQHLAPSACRRRCRAARWSATAGRSCRSRSRGRPPATGCRCGRRDGRRRRAGRSCRIPRRPRSARTQRACGTPCSRSASSARQRAEHRIAVVGAAAAIELVAFEHRDPRARGPRPSRSSPAACRGGRRAGRCRLRLARRLSMKISGVRPGQADDLQRRARQRGELRPRPGLEQRHRLVHVAVRRPVRVEGRRFVRGCGCSRPGSGRSRRSSTGR